MARRWQSWAWAALWLLGCDAGDRVRSEPFACRVNEDCVAGFWCDEGRCQPGQPQCAVDPDCPADQVCNNQVCGAIGDGRCRQDSDCPGDTVCDAAGRCAAREAAGCDDARPCPDGQACQGGACVAAWDEVCNGADDDLDGRVDEGAPAAGLDCPPVGRGACERSREAACIDGAIRCPAVEPGPASDEACNQQDDDCDGRVDEGLGAPGADERCDGVDNDCDGQVDEGQGVGEPCFVGDGPCRREGVYVCGDDGRNRCDAEPGQPGDELCNGEDDDCDGETDETFPEQGDRCPVGEGGCEADGVQICVGGELRCDGMPNLPVDEQCDGVDNDCNGVVDDVPTLGNACTSGLGPCTRMGVLVCAGAPNPVCDAVPADGREELCNGADDDCDGAVDEDLDCEGCDPSPERCNGVDDDCDGEVDEAIVGAGCTIGAGACLSLGQLACREGMMACNAEVVDPQAELCDGLDNDCDGAVDEGACGPGRCESDDDCPGPQVCIEGACGGVCEAEGPAQPAGCCEQAGDACLEARTYCPGLPELDPCPRRRKTVFSAGACVAAVVCEAEAEFGFAEDWCEELGGDRCEAGGCVPDPRCGPAACADQPEGARCAGGQARCVDGVCWGFANPSPEANARGPSFRVPIVDAEAGNRVVWSGSQEHDQYSDLMWSLGPDQGTPARADDWASAHAACQAFRGLDASDWRLPTVHEAVTLMGSRSWTGEPPLITRTHLDGEAVVVNPWPADGAPVVDTVPYDAPVAYRCVRYFQGRPALPADRFPDAGGDGWVGLAWAPQPQVHPTAAAALRACANHPDGLRLARVEEVIARLDARAGARGELRDAVDPNESEAWWFAIAEGDEQRYVRVQLSTLTIEDDAQPRGARALCVRPLNQQICAADADCAAPMVCHGDGRCHRGEQCFGDEDCEAGQVCLEGLCGREP